MHELRCCLAASSVYLTGKEEDNRKHTKIQTTKMANVSMHELDQVNRDLFDTYCSTCKDLFKDSFKKLGLVEPLRRVVLIGRLKYADRNKIKKYHEEMANTIDENIMDESSKLSGLMIIDKSFFYHILEGCDEAVNKVIDSTADFVVKGLIFGAKVIRTLSISFRYFNKWHSCVILTVDYVDPPFKKLDRTEESDIHTLAEVIEKFEDVVFVLVSYVLHLKTPRHEEKINELVPTSVLPFQKELENLYDEPFFVSVEKYRERYLTTEDYTSYMEKEWPPTGPAHDAKDYFDELKTFENRVNESLRTEEEQKKKKARHGTWWWS